MTTLIDYNKINIDNNNKYYNNNNKYNNIDINNDIDNIDDNDNNDKALEADQHAYPFLEICSFVKNSA